MKSIIISSFLALSLIITAEGQQYLNHQLRVEPVWSRVADALGEPGSVESAEFSRDGRFIVSGSKYDNAVIMWRTSDGAELWRQYTEQEIERVAWSSDGNYVAAGSEDYLVTVYHAVTGEVIRELEHNKGIDGLIWSNHSKLLVSGEEKTVLEDGSTKGFLRVFDMPSGKVVATMDFGNTVNEVFFSEDDRYLLAVGHGNVKVYDTSDWSLVQTLNPGYYVTFTSGNFSPDSKYVVAVGQAEGARGNIYLWDWKEGKLLRRFNHTGKKIESITWHPSGEYLVHAGHDPHIFVYRLKEVLKYKQDDIPLAHKVWASDNAEYIDFNRDGSFLVSAHQNGLIKLWVWMGEDPALNTNRHSWIKEQQKDAQ